MHLQPKSCQRVLHVGSCQCLTCGSFFSILPLVHVEVGRFPALLRLCHQRLHIGRHIGSVEHSSTRYFADLSSDRSAFLASAPLCVQPGQCRLPNTIGQIVQIISNLLLRVGGWQGGLCPIANDLGGDAGFVDVGQHFVLRQFRVVLRPSCCAPCIA